MYIKFGNAIEHTIICMNEKRDCRMAALLLLVCNLKSERGHLVAGNSFNNDRVGPETGLDVSLEVDEPVLRCDVEFSVYAFAAHAVCHVDLVVTVRNGDPDGLGVSKMSHGDLIEIDSESYCHSERVAHTVHLDNAFFRKDEGVAALCACTVAGNVCDLAA